MEDVSEEQRAVGQRLRDLRRAAGQSQAAAAAGAHISRQYLSEVEAGDANISLAVVIRLARHFGVTATSIVEVVDADLHDAIREATDARTATTDADAYAQVDKEEVQPLIDEAVDQGLTYPPPQQNP